MENEQLENSTEALCPRCGAGANSTFIGDDQLVVEILCPDCGRFEIPRGEFEDAEFDIAQSDEQQV